MKIGVVGKGGVGKTTLASLLARELRRRGRRVLAVDTDSNPNLGLSLGLDAEATEAVPTVPRSVVVGRRGDLTVAELMDGYAVDTPEGVMLMSALRVEAAGAGCTCAGHATVRSLLAEALDQQVDDTIVDMEAGLEHLSRSGGTLAHADVLVLVMEPSRKAAITAQRTIGLATDLGIDRFVGVANKMATGDLAGFESLCAQLGIPVDVVVPVATAVTAADRRGEPLAQHDASDVWRAVAHLADLVVLQPAPTG